MGCVDSKIAVRGEPPARSAPSSSRPSERLAGSSPVDNPLVCDDLSFPATGAQSAAPPGSSRPLESGSQSLRSSSADSHSSGNLRSWLLEQQADRTSKHHVPSSASVGGSADHSSSTDSRALDDAYAALSRSLAASSVELPGSGRSSLNSSMVMHHNDDSSRQSFDSQLSSAAAPQLTSAPLPALPPASVNLTDGEHQPHQPQGHRMIRRLSTRSAASSVTGADPSPCFSPLSRLSSRAAAYPSSPLAGVEAPRSERRNAAASPSTMDLSTRSIFPLEKLPFFFFFNLFRSFSILKRLLFLYHSFSLDFFLLLNVIFFPFSPSSYSFCKYILLFSSCFFFAFRLLLFSL
jgi:hypothetical protein